jgi:Uma2 family endonuclease
MRCCCSRLEDEVPFMATRTEDSLSLKTGDRLTREEFHRRYCARPDIKRAELIDGVVYVPSPLRGDYHGKPHGFVMLWLGTYALGVSEAECMDSTTLLLDGTVEVQPDAMLWRPVAGGPYMNERGFVVGPPQLIVEVSASSASYDLHEKKEAYRRNGVGEYVVWRVLGHAIDWFRLQDGQYVLAEPDADGIVESEQFPGLRLHVPSLLAGDMAAVLAALRGTAR